jgi:hypothetical protein
MVEEEHDVERKHWQGQHLEGAVKARIFGPLCANDRNGEDHQHIARRAKFCPINGSAIVLSRLIKRIVSRLSRKTQAASLQAVLCSVI